MLFTNTGKENTEQTLKEAYKRAKELGIKEVVLASTTGDTALKALEIFEDISIVSVSYHAGFKKDFKLSITDEDRKTLEEKGVKVICTSHALSGVERGLAKKMPGVYPLELVSQTLKLFGQGTKVAVEVALMAADAGAISGQPLIAIGGSSKGADTALVLTPAHQNSFFNMSIHEIVCKPSLL